MATLCHRFCGCFPTILYSSSHRQWESYPFVHTTIAGIYGCSIALIPPTIWHWKRPLISSPKSIAIRRFLEATKAQGTCPWISERNFKTWFSSKEEPPIASMMRLLLASSCDLEKKNVGKATGEQGGDGWDYVPGSWIIHWISGFGRPENGTLINSNPEKKAKASQNETFII